MNNNTAPSMERKYERDLVARDRTIKRRLACLATVALFYALKDFFASLAEWFEVEAL